MEAGEPACAEVHDCKPDAVPVDELLVLLNCPSCEKAFGSEDCESAPVLEPCGCHFVCGLCGSEADLAGFDKCCVCKKADGTKKRVGLNGLMQFAGKVHERVRADVAVASAPDCADCAMLGDEPQPALFVCEGCKGSDRAICEDHVAGHRKHASLKRLDSASSPVAMLCSVHADVPITHLCVTCSVAMCALCCLGTGSHPEATHAVN